MERKLIRGDTVEEQISSIDRILHSHQGKLGKKIVGLIPPIPIMHSARTIDEDGRIFAAVLPVKGRISTACFSIGKYNKRTAILEASLTHADDSVSAKRFTCRKPVEIFDTDLPVQVGDVLRINAADPTALTDVLVGILLHAELSQATAASQMYEEILKLQGANHASEN